MILAMDTATDLVSIALYHPDGIVAESTWRADRRHTVELVPEVERLLQQARRQPRDVTGIGVALGPGSFTGLRVALSVAKGFVAALEVPLVGVPTLTAMAYPLRHVRMPLYPVIRAGRGRYCAARHIRGEIDQELRVGSLPELAQGSGVALWFGELDAEARRELEGLLTAGSEVLGPTAGLRRAGAVAEITWCRIQAGQGDDPATLGPIYLRTAGLPGP